MQENGIVDKLIADACERLGFKLCGKHDCLHSMTAYIVRKGQLVAKIEPHRGAVTSHVWGPGWATFATQMPDPDTTMRDKIYASLATVHGAFIKEEM